MMLTLERNLIAMKGKNNKDEKLERKTLVATSKCTEEFPLYLINDYLTATQDRMMGRSLSWDTSGVI